MVDAERLVVGAALAALLGIGVMATSCRGKPGVGSADARASAAEPPPAEMGHPVAAVALIDRLPRCEVDHGGVLIDLGSPAAQGVTGSWSVAADPALVDSERDGETWAKVSSR